MNTDNDMNIKTEPHFKRLDHNHEKFLGSLKNDAGYFDMYIQKIDTRRFNLIYVDYPNVCSVQEITVCNKMELDMVSGEWRPKSAAPVIIKNPIMQIAYDLAVRKNIIKYGNQALTEVVSKEENEKLAIFKRLEKFFQRWETSPGWQECRLYLSRNLYLNSASAIVRKNGKTGQILYNAPFRVTTDKYEILEHGFNLTCKRVVILDVSHPLVMEFIEEKFRKYGKITVGFKYKSKIKYSIPKSIFIQKPVCKTTLRTEERMADLLEELAILNITNTKTEHFKNVVKAIEANVPTKYLIKMFMY